MLIDDLTCLLSAEQVPLFVPHTARALHQIGNEENFPWEFYMKKPVKNFNERFLHISNVKQEVMSFPPRLQASFSPAAEHIRSRF